MKFTRENPGADGAARGVNGNAILHTTADSTIRAARQAGLGPDTWCRIRATEPVQKHGARVRSIARFYTRSCFIRWCLPYGIWHCADGRGVLFDRTYTPICQRYPGQPATMADPAEFVDWECQQWFYHDGTPEKEKRAAAMAILEQWGMAQTVIDAAEHLRKCIQVGVRHA